MDGVVSTLTRIPLKGVVIVHFILTIWASQCVWLSPAYQYMNLFLLIVALWAIGTPSSIDSIQMLLVLHVISIVMEVILISVYFPKYTDAGSTEFKFSAAMAIINLILRPITAVIIATHYRARGGETNIGFSNPTYKGYENFDNPPTIGIPPQGSTPAGPSMGNQYGGP
ncbi:type-1 angiotensin II receptor-associated protein-like [Anneissia japonica]|uniref:type-1 angiotensin II receptor-associated protein-like n=1 Tax=Anneissia japonica TaxID=1529436 RepID=UPI0014254FD8|nr:type-1 angiotensin II receptor-associated protein-like [Anneissia japonica]